MTITSFCEVARDDLHYFSTPDRRPSERAAICCSYLQVYLKKLFTTLISIVDETQLNSDLELLAFDRRGEVDWPFLPGDYPCLRYELDYGQFFPLPPSVIQAKCSRGPDGSNMDPVGESIIVTAVPWLEQVDPSSIFRYTHKVRFYGFDLCSETGTPTIIDFD